MTNFNIEKGFYDYLKRQKIEAASISEAQLQEIKKMFFAGSGYMFSTLETTSSLPSEEEAIYVWKNMEYQLNEFFKVEVQKPSKLNHL